MSEVKDLNIYQRINAVMKVVEYIQKDSKIQGGGANYNAVSHDGLISIIRKELVEKGIVVYPEQLQSSMLIMRDLAKEIKMHLYSGDYAIHFVNMDDPKDRLTVTINAHANDNGDKAPGKAVTYATKAAILKVFSLETGDNDESRTAEQIEYTDHQKAQFDELLEADNGLNFVVFSQAVGPEVMTALNNSFVKGTISQGKAKCKQLSSDGWAVIKDYGVQIKELIANNDPAVGELVGELSIDEKRLVANQLEQSEIEYLRSI